MSSPRIKSSAQSGFAKADHYDRHRPSYPDESVTKLLDHLGILNLPQARIVDLAAGTGKLTELLAARPEGYEIVAVEPHHDMRQVLEGKKLPNVTVVDGTSSNMSSIKAQWADAVIAAQAFHWFANMESVKEIYRVIIPGGNLGLIWNVEDYNAPVDWKPSTVWESKLKDIIWSHKDLDPRFRHGDWLKVFDEQLKSSPATIQSADPMFSLPLGEDSLKWGVWLSKDGVWDRFRSISHVAVLQGEKFEAAKKTAFEAMDGQDVKKNEKDEVELHGVTVSYWTSAIPGAPLSSRG